MSTYTCTEEALLSVPLTVGATAELCDAGCGEWARLLLPSSALCDACWAELAHPDASGHYDVHQGIPTMAGDIAAQRFDQYLDRLHELRVERGPLKRTPELDALVDELISHRVDRLIASVAA